jgi:hypothetical protein
MVNTGFMGTILKRWNSKTVKLNLRHKMKKYNTLNDFFIISQKAEIL